MGEELLVTASEEPQIGELIKEYSRSTELDSGLGRISFADNTRYAKWEGQTEDGKKHQEHQPEGKVVFPWDGASDTRILLADSIINDNVDVLSTSFWRSALRVSGMEAGDVESAAVAQKVMDYMMNNRLYCTLAEEVDLTASYQEQYGWTVVHVGWTQEYSKRLREITMEEITASSETLPVMIMDPSRESEVVDLAMQMFPYLEPKDAKRFVKELREDGVTKIPVTYLTKNEPSISALKPWEDVTFPPETTDIQRSRMMFRREFMSEADVRAKGVGEDPWDADWIEAAVKQKGRSATSSALTLTTQEALGSPGLDTIDRKDDLIEVVWAYVRQVDSYGVPAIYCTVFHPHIEEVDGKLCYAHHGLLDYAHGKYPFVAFRRERVSARIVESRGVPEVVYTQQQEKKAQRDSLFDRTAFETLPPIKVPKRGGIQYKFGPAVQVTELRPNEISFMDPPRGGPIAAFDLMARLDQDVDAYFGRVSDTVSPDRAAVKQQRMVNNWLRSWNEVFSQVFALVQQYMPKEEIQRITGFDLPFDNNPTNISSQYDFILQFDVRELSNDYMSAKLKSMAELAALDTAGVIDKVKLIKIGMRVLDPSLARELITEEQTASKKMFRDVQNDVVMILNGVEPDYPEGDPSAGMKLKFLNDIVGRSQGAQQKITEDEPVKQLFQNYVKSLQFNVSQTENAQIGREGVKPLQ